MSVSSSSSRADVMMKGEVLNPINYYPFWVISEGLDVVRLSPADIFYKKDQFCSDSSQQPPSGP